VACLRISPSRLPLLARSLVLSASLACWGSSHGSPGASARPCSDSAAGVRGGRLGRDSRHPGGHADCGTFFVLGALAWGAVTIWYARRRGRLWMTTENCRSVTTEKCRSASSASAGGARAERELSERAGIASRTLDRLLVELEQLGGKLARGCVVIFDEAGMAPTRLSARLLQAAERAHAKVIAIGDPGQLASVQASGWLGAVGRALGPVRLTEVLRQRDPAERRALAALHEGLPRRYLEWAERAGRVQTFSERGGARERAVGEWLQASRASGITRAVMIARDNDTRAELNRAARELVRALGLLGQERSYGGLSLALGDRVICRRNDRLLDLDNGTRGTVRHLDEERVVIETDSHLMRTLPANYVCEHVEHAYALTGHGMQGATVETAIVLASPRDLTAGWSYTALSRARRTTHLLIEDERTAPERGELAPDARDTGDRHELLARVARRMLERDAEDLAIEQLPLAGHADNPQLALAGQTLADPVQEQAAARGELKTGPRSRQDLAALEQSVERVRAQRSALPVRKLTQLDDADARIGRLTSEPDRLLQTLRALPEPPPRRLLSRRRDPDELDRSRLVAAIGAYDGELERASRTVHASNESSATPSRCALSAPAWTGRSRTSAAGTTSWASASPSASWRARAHTIPFRAIVATRPSETQTTVSNWASRDARHTSSHRLAGCRGVPGDRADDSQLDRAGRPARGARGARLPNPPRGRRRPAHPRQRRQRLARNPPRRLDAEHNEPASWPQFRPVAVDLGRQDQRTA
jgi:AAA domain